MQWDTPQEDENGNSLEESGVQTSYTYNENEDVTDLGINLMDFNARWYDPAIGRFTSVDPLADHLTQVDKSPYAFSWNDPIALSDPSGEFPIVIPALIAAAEALFQATVITATTIVAVDTYDKVFDGSDDAPIDISTDDDSDDDTDDDRITLYRGVGTDDKGMHGLAMMGTAIPLGIPDGDGHSDPAAHNAGDNWSIFTSWSTSEEVAEKFAKNAGPGGVVLSKTFKLSEIVPSPDNFKEKEVLVPGIVRNANVRILK